MSTLQRTQILLEREQHKALTEMAHRSGRSMSDLVREILRERLTQKAREKEDAEFYEAIEWFDKLRAKIEAKHGILNVDLVEEVREEADRALDPIFGRPK